jgi:hypothetical protein
MRSFLKEIEDKFLELDSMHENLKSSLDEPNYIEVAIRDAKRALEIYADIARSFDEITTYGSNVYASFNGEEIQDLYDTFIKQNIEILEHNISIDEISTTSAVAGFNTPAAFAKPGKWQGKKARYESVNTPPSYKFNPFTDNDQYQKPESEEEEYNSKFPFALDGKEWQHAKYEYPSKNLVDTPGTTSKKHKTLRVEDVLEQKYEQLIEGYRSFATSDSKTTPEQKVKNTIKEVAKKLQEIETMVNYNSKLKTESGVTSSAYGNSTKKALAKISERLVKISERVRSLGE